MSYPIHFEPIYQDYVWGGERIASQFHRAKQKGNIAESWEICDRPEAMSLVTNGPLKGRTLQELVQELGEGLLGKGQKFDRFPLLLKIIDAKESLSVQVHPDESAASHLKGEPKSEMWLALEDSTIFAGLQKGVVKEDFIQAIEKKKVEKCLQKLDLLRGEAIYIPGGRVHAICAGSLLFEVQQNSNTTYRLFDWGRNRPLQLEEGLAAIHWHEAQAVKATPHHFESDLHHQVISLVHSPFFIAERIDIFKHLHVTPNQRSFQIFFGLEGEGELEVDGNKEPIRPGITYLVPSSAKLIEIDGRCQVLRVRLP